MKTRKLWMLATILFCGTIGAQAQQAVNTDNGKAVRRIAFDRDHVTILYADGTQEEGVKQATIRRSDQGGVTGVSEAVPPQKAEKMRYTLDGRRVVNGQLPKGVYIEREGNRVRKTVKK